MFGAEFATALRVVKVREVVGTLANSLELRTEKLAIRRVRNYTRPFLGLRLGLAA